MASHILVTGGAGFIGSHLTRRLLARGDRVTVLDDFNDFYDPARKRENVAPFLAVPGYRLAEGDIRDGARVDRLYAEGKFDAVVHLAARAGVRPSLAEPILYEDVNCIGTLRLLEAARSHPDVVCGVHLGIVEGALQEWAMPSQTAELLPFSEPGACLRFFTVFGPGQRPEMAIHKFTDLLWRGQSVPVFGDGGSRRDYTFVDDIVDGLTASLDLAPGFEILNLGGAETTSLRDLVLWIAEELAVEPRIDYLPAQPGDVPITYADISKAARILGYSPKVPIREGLRRFVSWYRERAERQKNSNIS